MKNKELRFIATVGGGVISLHMHLKNYVLLSYYAASSGNSLQTFRDNLTFPS